MRIRDLLENTEFMDLTFGQKEKAKNEPDFDVLEDLIFFMNNDDDTYRRHVYPIIRSCLEAVKARKDTDPTIFADAVKNGYKNYLGNYGLQELPDDLDKKQIKEACKKMHEQVYQQISSGKYKD
jgi:hypothetical protein